MQDEEERKRRRLAAQVLLDVLVQFSPEFFEALDEALQHALDRHMEEILRSTLAVLNQECDPGQLKRLIEVVADRLCVQVGDEARFIYES